MIVRVWWRPQAYLARRPALTWLILGVATLVAVIPLKQAPRPVALAGIAAGLAAIVAARGLAGALAGFAAVQMAIAAAVWAGGGRETCIAIGVLAALIAGPAAAHLGGRDPLRAQHEAGRATGFAWLGLQFAALGALGAGDRAALVACVVLAVVVSLPLLAAVMAPPAQPWTPLPLDAERETSWTERLLLPLILVGAGLVGLSSASSPPDPAAALSGWLPSLLLIALLWGLATLRLGVGLAALAGLIAGLAWAKALHLDTRPEPLLLGIFQIAPLLLWRAKEALGAPPAAMAMAVLLVISVGVLVPGWQTAAVGAAGVAVALALLPKPRAGRADGPLATARRALAGLDPYARCYGRAKLALDPLYRRLVAETRPWGRVLDLGCGPGLVAALAAGRVDVEGYTGIDLDLDKLLIARRMLRRCDRPLSPDWRLVHAQMPLGAAPTERFTTVFLLDVLHYAPLATQREMLAQARQCLADDGVLYLRDGLADAAGQVGRVGLGERFTTALGLNPVGGLHFLDEATMRALLSETGFRVVSCEPCGGENRLWICQPALRMADGI